MSTILHCVFKNIKRVRKIPDKGKVAAASPIYKKGDKRLMEIYRPVSLLNIMGKIRQKCMYPLLFDHFIKFLTRNQHGFVNKNRSVITNMLSFLKEIYKAIDNNAENHVIEFYTDFSKAFDKVPLYELLQKTSNIGVGGCFLEIISDFLSNRKQFVRADNFSSETLEITSGVPQESLIGPLFFCIFINDLPELLKFSDPYVFAHDLKSLAVNVDTKDIQQDLKSVENLVDKNKMSLALHKCFEVDFRGNQHEVFLCETAVESPNVIKDLGIHVSKHLTWTTHIDSRMSKASKTFYCIRRNLEFKVKMRIKLGLYKSLTLPVLTYGLIICNFSRNDLGRLEKFQKKVLKWIRGNGSVYTEQLRLLNILPLALFLQLNDLLMMERLYGLCQVQQIS